MESIDENLHRTCGRVTCSSLLLCSGSWRSLPSEKSFPPTRSPSARPVTGIGAREAAMTAIVAARTTVWASDKGAASRCDTPESPEIIVGIP